MVGLPSGHGSTSLIYQKPLPVNNFVASFEFIPDGANVAFLLNNTNNQPGTNSAEGGTFTAGAGCEAGFYQAFGYQETPPNPEPNNVFALELDSASTLSASAPYPFVFSHSSTQIYSSNQSPCIPAPVSTDYALSKISTAPVSLNSPVSSSDTSTGDTYSATISYDGSNVTLNLYDVSAGGSCPGSGCFTYTWSNVNIPSLVGGSTAYAGLTAGTSDTPYGAVTPLVIRQFSYTTGSVAAPAPTVDTPTFLPGPGTYTLAQTVTISDTTPGATIYYSVNGAAETIYTKPLTVGQNESIAAYATAPGDTESSTSIVSYTINIPVTLPASLSIPAQTLTIQTSGSPITVTIPAQTVTLP
jgi:hypothetical protein